MPRYAFQKPRARVYAYNYGYMNNYYKPLSHYLGGKDRAPSEQPGHQSLAERLKTFPMDGSVYRNLRSSSCPPEYRMPPDAEARAMAPRASEPPEVAPHPPPARESSVPVTTYSYVAPGRARSPHVYPRQASPFPERPSIERSGWDQEEPNKKHLPIWMKHPYRLAVEDIRVPPHESSIWPERVPHFSLVSSYDLMVGFLGIQKPSTCISL